MRTYTGREVNVLDFKPTDVCIEDIAHSLSQLCRFTGHTASHYSVAQHCILVSRLAPKEVSLEALLHDAEEAYTGDMHADLKHCGDNAYFIHVGDQIQRTILNRYGMEHTNEIHAAIKPVDKKVCEWERQSLFRNSTSTLIEPWPADKAEFEFLKAFALQFRDRFEPR